jgi:hypothetical protein
MQVDGDYYLLSDSFKEDIHFIRPPLVSSDVDKADVEVEICVGAIDTYQAYSEECQEKEEVRNKLDHIGNYASISSLLLSLEYTSSNLTSTIFAANMLYFGMN